MQEVEIRVYVGEAMVSEGPEHVSSYLAGSAHSVGLPPIAMTILALIRIVRDNRQENDPHYSTDRGIAPEPFSGS